MLPQGMKPLIKWAGGKRQILPQLVSLMPERWNRYYEPFAGGLALLVELHNMGRLGSAVISETNPELYNLYRTVRDEPVVLSETIERMDFRNEGTFYYNMRDRFNTLIGLEGNEMERAAIFLYLNRHGFNGLWRVNRKGKFNVPFGSYLNPQLPEMEEILNFSTLLKRVEILNEDFQVAVEDAREGDFVYFDPPYVPVSRTSSFTDYTAEGFEISDQERLFETCQNLNRKGISFLMSNSSSEKISELFGGYNIIKVEARRSINSNSSKRNGHTEFIVSNNCKTVVTQETSRRSE